MNLGQESYLPLLTFNSIYTYIYMYMSRACCSIWSKGSLKESRRICKLRWHRKCHHATGLYRGASSIIIYMCIYMD